MEMRRLGRTGLQVSPIGFGSIPIQRAQPDHAARVVRAALDAGINYLDCARGYGTEEKVGAGIRGRRDQCVIASKSGSRDAEGILQDIEASLTALGTDYLDAYKCHGVITPDDWAKVTAPGGAMEGLARAREQGKIRFIGISSHRPETVLEAIRTGLVDLFLLVFNFVRREAADQLLPAAKELDVAATIMKPVGGSLFARPDLCLRWVLQHPVSSVPVGMWLESEIEMNARVGRDPQPLAPEESAWLEQERLRWDKRYCRLCYTCEGKCSEGVPYQGLMITDLGYRRQGLPLLAERPGFAEQVAEMEKCMTCAHESCNQACAFDLPVARIMREHYANYGALFAAAAASRPPE